MGDSFENAIGKFSPQIKHFALVNPLSMSAKMGLKSAGNSAKNGSSFVSNRKPRS